MVAVTKKMLAKNMMAILLHCSHDPLSLPVISVKKKRAIMDITPKVIGNHIVRVGFTFLSNRSELFIKAF